jgi:iron complex transport system ATP-binding protein
VAEGSPSEIVTVDLVREVFGIEAIIVPDPASGTPLISPVGRHHRTP